MFPLRQFSKIACRHPSISSDSFIILRRWSATKWAPSSRPILIARRAKVDYGRNIIALGGRRGVPVRAECIENLGGCFLDVLQAGRQELCVTFVKLDVVLRS
jgi:hypothetical protein